MLSTSLEFSCSNNLRPSLSDSIFRFSKDVEYIKLAPKLINIDKYRNYCLENGLLTNSALYFKTSAETSFQYLMKKYDFIEDHTALSDAEIESQILVKALKKGAITPNVSAFPFRSLGTTYEYEKKKKKYITIVKEKLETYLETVNESTGYYTRIENILLSL